MLTVRHRDRSRKLPYASYTGRHVHGGLSDGTAHPENHGLLLWTLRIIRRGCVKSVILYPSIRARTCVRADSKRHKLRVAELQHRNHEYLAERATACPGASHGPCLLACPTSLTSTVPCGIHLVVPQARSTKTVPAAAVEVSCSACGRETANTESLIVLRSERE